MPYVTEIAFAPLKKDINLTQPGSDAYSTLTQKSLKLIKNWKGCKKIFWGIGIEDPDKLRLFVDWESVQVHEAANADPAYLPAVLPIASLCSGPHTMFHAEFEPYIPELLSKSPVVEVMTMYFPSEYTKADQNVHHQGIRLFLEACEKHADGYLMGTGGWVIEEQQVGNVGAAAYIALLGWSSVEAHAAFRETPQFKELSDHVRQAKDLRTLEVEHVKVEEFV